MKKSIFSVVIIFIFFNCTAFGQRGKNKADKDTYEWRYEIEVNGVGTQGNYQLKVWSYSKNPETAIEQAKKNAVHGVIFKGFPAKERLRGQKALAQSPTLEEEKEDYFKEFFSDGGRFQKFVTLTLNGAIDPSDRVKIGKEYKIGVIVSVDVAGLRNDLEGAGIIKPLGSGF
jgi:hypothetical protein